MTVSNTNTKDKFITNGVTTVFPFTFYLTTTNQVKAKTIDSNGVETEYTNFTVTINPDGNGGSFTTGDVLNNVDLLVFRQTPQTQETDYVEGGRFPAESHEDALDKLTQQNQEQQEEIDRTLKTSIGSDNNYQLSNNLVEDELLYTKSNVISSTGTTLEDLNKAIENARLLGYLPPIPYAGGIVFDNGDNQKTIERNGIIYAPLPSQIPFTTSGTWTGDDENKFFVVQGVTTSSLPTLTDLVFDSVADMFNGAPVDSISEIGSTRLKRNAAANALSSFEALGEVGFRDLGGIDDGTTSGLSLFNDIKTIQKIGVVVFDGVDGGNGFYLENPDIAQTTLKSVNDGFIVVDTTAGIVKRCNLVNDLRIVRQSWSLDETYPKNRKISPELLNASSGLTRPNIESAEAINLSTDVRVSVTDITGYNTRSASSATIVDDGILAWASPSSLESGFFSRVEVGDYIEGCGYLTGSGTTGAYYTSILTTEYRYIFQSFIGSTTIDFIRINTSDNASLIETFTTDPNANFAIVSPGGSMVPSIRVTSKNEFEFYINDVLFRKVTSDGLIQEVGFTFEAAATIVSQSPQIYYPVRTTGKEPKGGRPLNIACVGDSQTFGEDSSVTWPEMMSFVAQNFQGIGDITTTNYGFPGEGWAYFRTGAGSSIDFSPFDYTLIMLGTNDVQGERSLNAFGGDVEVVLNNMIADGTRPIVGMFPVWTNSTNSGQGDPNAKNSELAAKYRAEMKRRALKVGAAVCSPLTYFGNNLTWMPDNIHPKSEGQVAIASSFAAALSGEVSPKENSNEGVGYIPTLVNGFATPSGYQPLTVTKVGGMVYLTGAVRNGSTNTTICTLPEEYRPSGTIRAACESSQGYGFVEVLANGVVSFPVGADTDITAINVSWLSA